MNIEEMRVGTDDDLKKTLETPFGSPNWIVCLRSAFIWRESPQGSNYWLDVAAGKNTNEAEIMQNLREIYAQYLMEKDL